MTPYLQGFAIGALFTLAAVAIVVYLAGRRL